MEHLSPADADVAQALYSGSFEDDFANAELVTTPARGNPPISLRLSAPLLERLDRLAEAQHRKRSNLIQHVLWEYVHAHDERRPSAVSSRDGAVRTKRSA